MLDVPFSSLLLTATPHDGSLQYLVLGGAGLLVIYVLMRPKKKKDPLIPSSPRLSIAQQKSVERQMESLLVEFSKMARQMSAQLDTRAAKLELLLKEADEKLAALREASAAAGPRHPEPQTLPSNGQGSPEQDPLPVPPLTAHRQGSRHAEVYGLSDQGRSAQEIAREIGRPSGEVELILALRPKEGMGGNDE